MDTPTISCGAVSEKSINLQVCAGPSGAPGGFTIHWMKCDDFSANGNRWPVDSGCAPGDPAFPDCPPSYCHGSFSGNASGSRYNLAPGECVTVNIGEFLFDNGASTPAGCATALDCGTCYVFRVFAHADSKLRRSEWTADHRCSTTTCGCPQPPNCTYTQGYWKNHGPAGCASGNNTNEWPVASLTLGTVLYNDSQLCSIFNEPAKGNGLLTLAHQLIAAKLNVAKGADPTDAAACIAAADALIGGLVIPPVGGASVPTSATDSLTVCLRDYNEGATGPGHCC